jgi:hypothetical protein
MLYWECKRRLELLHQFRGLAFNYFENIQHAHWAAGGAPPTMNDKAQKARHEMNHAMEDVVLSFDLLGIVHVVRWTPPRAVGGYMQNVDLIVNIFDLYGFRIPPQMVFDCTDRAVGAYERECRRLLRKSFNPLYWLGILIVWVLRLPFKLLGVAGFDANKVEESAFGKTLKLTWGLTLGFAAIIPAIFEIHDHWSVVRQFLNTCAAALHRLWA